MVCLRNISVDTLHKGENADDDDNNNNNNGYRNFINKETEKILKYKDLTIETERIQNVKTKVILVLIGVTGTISKSFRQYLNNIPRKHEIKELQTTAIFGTAHKLWKVLM
jgi:galactokinase/mevalonate kinase-like predicted kinase